MADMNKPLLEVKNLKTFFKTRNGIVKAVNDVSYSIYPGKTLGIVGESGSGKSVSAMSVLRLLDAGDCEAELEGTQLFYLGLQMGMELGRLNLWNQS